MSISSSTFQDNYSFGRGSIIYAGEANANAYLENSQVQHNYAITGGVFFSQLGALI